MRFLGFFLLNSITLFGMILVFSVQKVFRNFSRVAFLQGLVQCFTLVSGECPNSNALSEGVKPSSSSRLLTVRRNVQLVLASPTLSKTLWRYGSRWISSVGSQNDGWWRLSSLLAVLFFVPKIQYGWYNKHDIQLSCCVCYDMNGA